MFLSKKYFKIKTEQKRKKQFDDGYAYAAARLLKSSNMHSEEKTVDVLADLKALTYGVYDPFDKGITEAIVDFKVLIKVL